MMVQHQLCKVVSISINVTYLALQLSSLPSKPFIDNGIIDPISHACTDLIHCNSYVVSAPGINEGSIASPSFAPNYGDCPAACWSKVSDIRL
jgi:hypothetical protein